MKIEEAQEMLELAKSIALLIPTAFEEVDGITTDSKLEKANELNNKCQLLRDRVSYLWHEASNKQLDLLMQQKRAKWLQAIDDLCQSLTPAQLSILKQLDVKLIDNSKLIDNDVARAYQLAALALTFCDANDPRLPDMLAVAKGLYKIVEDIKND